MGCCSSSTDVADNNSAARDVKVSQKSRLSNWWQRSTVIHPLKSPASTNAATAGEPISEKSGSSISLPEPTPVCHEGPKGDFVDFHSSDMTSSATTEETEGNLDKNWKLCLESDFEVRQSGLDSEEKLNENPSPMVAEEKHDNSGISKEKDACGKQYDFFEIAIDNKSQDNNNNDYDYLKNSVPHRLKKLEPLLDAPKLTIESLEEKLKSAEEKRIRALERRKEAGKKSKNRCSGILKQNETSSTQFSQEANQQLIVKVTSADQNREAKLARMQERFSIQEERGRRARNKVERMRQIDREIASELEIMNDDDGSSSISDTDLMAPGTCSILSYSRENSAKSQTHLKNTIRVQSQEDIERISPTSSTDLFFD